MEKSPFRAMFRRLCSHIKNKLLHIFLTFALFLIPVGSRAAKKRLQNRRRRQIPRFPLMNKKRPALTKIKISNYKKPVCAHVKLHILHVPGRDEEHNKNRSQEDQAKLLCNCRHLFFTYLIILKSTLLTFAFGKCICVEWAFTFCAYNIDGFRVSKCLPESIDMLAPT